MERTLSAHAARRTLTGGGGAIADWRSGWERSRIARAAGADSRRWMAFELWQPIARPQTQRLIPRLLSCLLQEDRTQDVHSAWQDLAQGTVSRHWRGNVY
ncbi:hypothetical protein NDU88_007702 [Pleurodeles waltl]|uniref:Uncharacterized protein n=1 Tax=Pleurodeles waltl TaxID=8319 RepID=A0AAV7QNT2_PLEWA|nr:hypothetical protein NDU88_007702 [Pleurodeles waltl]